jgi:hypothetical protein
VANRAVEAGQVGVFQKLALEIDTARDEVADGRQGGASIGVLAEIGNGRMVGMVPRSTIGWRRGSDG